LQETEEFSCQVDVIVARHSRDVILPVLTGILDGIAKNPRELDQTTWNTRIAKSAHLGLTVPRLKIIFQIQNEGQPDEYVLLLWIQESDAAEDLMI
jgi:hypothetical protein